MVIALLAAVLPLADPAPPPAVAATIHESGFVLEPVFGGATVVGPASIRFAPAPDDRVFIAERRGRVRVFDNIYDSAADTILNIEDRVHGYWDRGLLGIALDPDFGTDPWIYLLYALDTGDEWEPLDGNGSAAPWGSSCPTPPGATDDGCVVDGELIRIRVNANNSVTRTETLLTGHWCQQYPSHSIGDLGFGTDGYLYVSAGDGASFNWADYGQGGGDADNGNRTPNNPCLDYDPDPGGVNHPYMSNPEMTLPDAEGGALRSQDLRTSADPLGYDGTVLRIDPDTGAAASGNPLSGGAKARVIAHGLRNPYRFTIRPGTNQVWLGDVGWSTWEEINVIADPGGTVENFGWPCYEGNGKQPGYDALDADLCENLYDDPSDGGRSTLAAPFYAYGHGSAKPDSTGCGGAGASISGLAFPETTTYPATFDDALVFSDYSYSCTWTMFAAGGNPNPNDIDTLISGLGVVDLRSGPGGELYLSEFIPGNTGRFWRLTYPAGNTGPSAAITASTTEGQAPLAVDLDGSGSSDPDGDQLTYAWDLDNDGQFDDGSGSTAQVTLTTPGDHDVRLRVRDFYGNPNVKSVTLTVVSDPVTNQPPALGALFDRQIDEETLLSFTASATDPDVPPDTLTFSLLPGSGTFPSGATIDPTTGEFRWTPTEAQGPGTYRVVVEVSDDGTPSLSDDEEITITVNEVNEPPVATITQPTAGTSWAVDDPIAFAGTASDSEDGALRASQFEWEILLHHCETPDDCHVHTIETVAGVKSGSTVGPDHEYPSFLEIALTVTDIDGGSDRTSVEVWPETVKLRVNTSPTGLTATIGETTEVTPFSVEVVIGSEHTLSVPFHQPCGEVLCTFESWSDGGTRIHTITAPDEDITYKATYVGPVVCRGRIATVVGTEEPETLEGTGGDDVIAGLGGNDIINGLSGSDVICGGKGDDELRGGHGSDVLAGGAGFDVASFAGATRSVTADLKGGSASGMGSDALRRVEGLIGSSHDDTLRGSKKANTIQSGSGADSVRTGRGADVIRGAAGDDELWGGAGNDELAGGPGADRLSGNDGRDLIRGNRGDDQLLGKADDDLLYGGAGDDEIRGGSGQDTCFAGELLTSCEVPVGSFVAAPGRPPLVSRLPED